MAPDLRKIKQEIHNLLYNNKIGGERSLLAKKISDYCNDEIKINEQEKEFFDTIKKNVRVISNILFNEPTKIQFTNVAGAYYLVFINEEKYNRYGSYVDYYYNCDALSFTPRPELGEDNILVKFIDAVLLV